MRLDHRQPRSLVVPTLIMISINIETAEKDLAQLIAQVRAGEEIVITKDDEPVAKLVAVANHRKLRVPGRLKGQANLPDSFFFDPLPEDELNLWSGDADDRR
jgi:prevent-host-death family protein